MSEPFTQFVTIPYITSQLLEEIHYKDVLIYAVLKSFKNNETDLCCPSNEVVAKIANVGRNFVRQSLIRLEEAKLIFIDRSEKIKVVHHYHFARLNLYNRIPVGVLKANLTANQKAILICLAQFFFGEGIRIPRNIKDKANRLGMSYKMLYSQYIPLVEQGFIIETVRHYKFSDQSKIYHELSDKFEWFYPPGVSEHYAALNTQQREPCKFIMGEPFPLAHIELSAEVDKQANYLVLQ